VRDGNRFTQDSGLYVLRLTALLMPRVVYSGLGTQAAEQSNADETRPYASFCLP
jgi:hypothetical protein